MIAVTSRPQLARHREVDAEETWRGQFTDWIILNHDEPPTILALVQNCAMRPGWSCLINADIQVRHIPELEAKLNGVGASCCISQRYELPIGKVMDLGLDFFAAQQQVWNAALAKVPECFRIGHVLWDTWMLQFLCIHFWKEFYDVTPCRCVFHPKHNERGDQSMTAPAGDPYLARESMWPDKALEL